MPDVTDDLNLKFDAENIDTSLQIIDQVFEANDTCLGRHNLRIVVAQMTSYIEKNREASIPILNKLANYVMWSTANKVCEIFLYTYSYYKPNVELRQVNPLILIKDMFHFLVGYGTPAGRVPVMQTCYESCCEHGVRTEAVYCVYIALHNCAYRTEYEGVLYDRAVDIMGFSAEDNMPSLAIRPNVEAMQYWLPDIKINSADLDTTQGNGLIAIRFKSREGGAPFVTLECSTSSIENFLSLISPRPSLKIMCAEAIVRALSVESEVAKLPCATLRSKVKQLPLPEMLKEFIWQHKDKYSLIVKHYFDVLAENLLSTPSSHADEGLPEAPGLQNAILTSATVEGTERQHHCCSVQ